MLFFLPAPTAPMHGKYLCRPPLLIGLGSGGTPVETELGPDATDQTDQRADLTDAVGLGERALVAVVWARHRSPQRAEAGTSRGQQKPPKAEVAAQPPARPFGSSEPGNRAYAPMWVAVKGLFDAHASPPPLAPRWVAGTH